MSLFLYSYQCTADSINQPVKLLYSHSRAVYIVLPSLCERVCDHYCFSSIVTCMEIRQLRVAFFFGRSFI